MATPSYHIAVTVPVGGQTTEAATALEQAFDADELLATPDAVIGHPDTCEVEVDFEHVRTASHLRSALRAMNAVEHASRRAELPGAQWVKVDVERDPPTATPQRPGVLSAAGDS